MRFHATAGLTLVPLLAIPVLAAFLAPPARAASAPDNSRILSPLAYPGAPRAPAGETRGPYAMSYADEAVESLGFRDGHMDVFSARPSDGDPLMPVFSGGLGSGGAMLRLRWQPGL